MKLLGSNDRTGWKLLFWLVVPSVLLQWRTSGWHLDGATALRLGLLLCAVAGALASFSLARSAFPASASFFAVLVTYYGTFLAWYVLFEPTASTALGFTLGAVCLRVWWDGREHLSLWRAVLLGALIGLGTALRWPNAAFLLLPIATCAAALRHGESRTHALKAATFVFLGFVIGILPDLLPSAGGELLPRTTPPRFLDMLFSSRHGLLFWTPVLWLSLVGLVALAWKRPRPWLALTLLVGVTMGLNAASADGLAPTRFSERLFPFPNPCFDAMLPALTLGLAASLASIISWAGRHPARLVAAGGALLSVWNGLFMETYKRGGIPRDDTVSFADVTRLNTEQFSLLFGSPVAWPANWLFARRTGLSAAAYDEMVGKDLFSPPQSVYGIVDFGDPRVDPALLGEGFGARRVYQGEICRRVDGTARFFANLERREDLTLAVRAAGSGRLFVLANGEPLGSMSLGPNLTARGLSVPRRVLRLPLSEFTLRVSAGGTATIDRLVFERMR